MAGIIKVANDAKSKNSNEEQIFNAFQLLREQQRLIASKLSGCEIEENELKVVISTLEKVDGNRKCYRLIGGVLCQKTVKDVLPVLIEKKDELAKSQVKLKEDLMKKGVELNEFKEKHNIRIEGQEDNASQAGDTDSSSTATGILNIESVMTTSEQLT